MAILSEAAWKFGHFWYIVISKCEFSQPGGTGFDVTQKRRSENWYRYVERHTLTINDNDMLSYSLTTMMCFLTKEWYGFPVYTVNLFIKAYHKITYKEDLNNT